MNQVRLEDRRDQAGRKVQRGDESQRSHRLGVLIPLVAEQSQRSCLRAEGTQCCGGGRARLLHLLICAESEDSVQLMGGDITDRQQKE